MFQAVLLAVAADTDSGFNLGTLLMFVGGAILLAFFCSLGLIARLREHRLEQRREAAKSAASPKASESGPA